jgi:hypothetical protein
VRRRRRQRNLAAARAEKDGDSGRDGGGGGSGGEAPRDGKWHTANSRVLRIAAREMLGDAAVGLCTLNQVDP